MLEGFLVSYFIFSPFDETTLWFLIVCMILGCLLGVIYAGVKNGMSGENTENALFCGLSGTFYGLLFPIIIMLSPLCTTIIFIYQLTKHITKFVNTNNNAQKDP